MNARALGVTLAAAALVLAGCGNTVDRAASAVSTQAALPADSGVDEGSPLTSWLLGTMVCIVNQSSADAEVTFTKFDTYRKVGKIARGDSTCGEGTFFTGNDVAGRIALAAPHRSMTFWGNNEAFSSPGAGVGQQDGNRCIGGMWYSVGTSEVWDDGTLSFTVQRASDDKWKQFTITIEDSKKPSADGKPAVCVAGPDPAVAS